MRQLRPSVLLAVPLKTLNPTTVDNNRLGFAPISNPQTPHLLQVPIECLACWNRFVHVRIYPRASKTVARLCCQAPAGIPAGGSVGEAAQHISLTAYYLICCPQHIKYLRQEFALDALAQYAVEPDDPTREVPNPKWAAVDAQLRQAYARLDRLQAEYGLEAFTNLEERRRTMRGFKAAQGKLGRQIWEALERVEKLEARRQRVPRRVPVQSVSSEPVVKLAPEIQHLTNIVKMVAYQAESDLLRTVAPYYRRADDEGRTLIQSALASSADLEVTQNELRVTLAPLSSPHRTRAIAALCETLNQSNVWFPGSSLRLRYAVRGGS
jgi:hypothetical protein